MPDWDQSEFDATLARYILESPREISEIVNKKMAIIINEARSLTPIADRAEIEAEFGIQVKTRISKKTGQTRRKVIGVVAPPGVGLVIANWIRAGKPWKPGRGGVGPTNAQLADMARRLPTKRLRAVGSLRSGWARAIRAYLRATGEGTAPSGPRVKATGSANPAKPGWDPIAKVVFNLATQTAHDKSLHIDPRVESAISQAFEKETASMKEYIEKKMQERATAISAK